MRYAGMLQDLGRAEEALRELSLAEESNPLTIQTISAHANLRLWLGRYDEALVKFERVGELDPARRQYHGFLAFYYHYRSDTTNCLRQIQLSEDLEPDHRGKRLMPACSHLVSGKKEEARALVLEEESLPEVGLMPYQVALLYAELGDLDGCSRWLNHQGPTLPLQALQLDPDYANVRRNPRYRVLLKRLKLA